MTLPSAPGEISSLFTITNTSFAITPTSPDLRARAGAALQCSLCHGYQEHELSESPGPRIMNVPPSSYCILGLDLSDRHFQVYLMPCPTFCS